MFILLRYISVSVVRGFLLLALIMVLLFSMILLIDELDQVGTGNYDWWLAIKYVLYHMPKLLLDFAAFISLVGSILALGYLASHYELVAIESIGVSPRSVINYVLFAAFLLMVLILMNAQFAIPATLQKAHIEKTLALEAKGGFVSGSGYWAQSDNRFIHIRDVENGRIPIDVEIFEFNQRYELLRYLFAKKVLLAGDQLWELNDVTEKQVVNGQLIANHYDKKQWNSFMSSTQLGVVISQPEALSLSNLYHYVQGLKQRGEQSYRYELLFWQRITTPISAAIMILLGMPFVFGSQRSVSTGKRITLGVLAGITFYVISQVVSYFGSLMQWSPLMIAILPSSVVLVILFLIHWRFTHNHAVI